MCAVHHRPVRGPHVDMCMGARVVCTGTALRKTPLDCSGRLCCAHVVGTLSDRQRAAADGRWDGTNGKETGRLTGGRG